MKSEEKVERNQLHTACLGDGGDLFEEIKKLRQTKRTVATSIDGEKNNIAEHFGNIYSKLYNSAEDEAETKEVKSLVENAVNERSLEDVKMITPEVIKKAAHKLKAGKSDPSFSCSSYCFKNSLDNVFISLSELIQRFLIHGHVTMVILVSTLIPIVKDPLSSMSSSKNIEVCVYQGL